MINYIQGTLLEVEADTCTVLTSAGVGYQLHIPGAVQDRLPSLGEEVEFYVRTVVKEDSIDLYGFTNKEDKSMFVILVSVSKLGPKTALAMLSTFNANNLREIILREDFNTLTRVSGIGPKSAKRIIWELREKLSDGETTVPASNGKKDTGTKSSVYTDALSALINLGYGESEIRPLLSEVLQESPDLILPEAIKSTLKKMNKDR